MKNIKTWYKGLSTMSKVGLWAVVAVAAGAVAASAQDAPKQQAIDQPIPVSHAQQEQPKTPVITTETITETAEVPFERTTVNDGSLDADTTIIRTTGMNGVKTFTYEVTYQDGEETDKKLIREEVTTAPITEVTAIGTKVQSSCDPNYSGACVPIASDVDCAGGSGNGPAYVSGPVFVKGSDIYDLDHDGNGIGCE